jgi:hypothetical protein
LNGIRRGRSGWATWLVARRHCHQPMLVENVAPSLSSICAIGLRKLHRCLWRHKVMEVRFRWSWVEHLRSVGKSRLLPDGIPQMELILLLQTRRYRCYVCAVSIRMGGSGAQ